ETCGGIGVGDGDLADAGRTDLLGEQIRLASARGETDDFEVVGIGGDHVECLGTDGTGTAQQEHPGAGRRSSVGHASIVPHAPEQFLNRPVSTPRQAPHACPASYDAGSYVTISSNSSIW